MQFDKVDLAAPGEARGCRICKRAIADEYFEIARAVICRSCATALSGSKEGRGTFGRALLFGVGAALLGTIVWYAITKISGYEFGLLAIGVGLFVGVAVKRGGRGLGGWRYQALAMVLTYVSITAARYVPMLILEASDAKRSRGDGNGARGERGAGAERCTRRHRDGPAARSRAPALALALALLLGLAFIAPFMGGASNIMGIIIVGIGLYEAWK